MTSRTKGIISLIILSVIYAGTGVITRFLDPYFSPFQQIYLRTILAFIFGLFIFRKSLDYQKLKRINRKEWILLLLRSGAMFVFGATLWVKATTLTKLANVTFIDALPLTAALSLIFRWKNLRLKNYFIYYCH